MNDKDRAMFEPDKTFTDKNKIGLDISYIINSLIIIYPSLPGRTRPDSANYHR